MGKKISKKALKKAKKCYDKRKPPTLADILPPNIVATFYDKVNYVKIFNTVRHLEMAYAVPDKFLGDIEIHLRSLKHCYRSEGIFIECSLRLAYAVCEFLSTKIRCTEAYMLLRKRINEAAIDYYESVSGAIPMPYPEIILILTIFHDIEEVYGNMIYDLTDADILSSHDTVWLTAVKQVLKVWNEFYTGYVFMKNTTHRLGYITMQDFAKRFGFYCHEGTEQDCITRVLNAADASHHRSDAEII